MLSVKKFSITVGSAQVVAGISFVLKPGTVTVLMGPNGSGKSSLLNALAGHPFYTITSGSVIFNGKTITDVTPDKRARAGLFLSVQHPHTVPGVTVNMLLRESFRAINGNASLHEFDRRVQTALKQLKLDVSFLARHVNDGFSGGEKKRCEMLQMLVLRPKLVLLDEIDSGLDVDALKCVGKVLKKYAQNNPESAFFIVTHYQAILKYITPDHVYVMANGGLVHSGNAAILPQIQKAGYAQFDQS